MNLLNHMHVRHPPSFLKSFECKYVCVRVCLCARACSCMYGQMYMHIYMGACVANVCAYTYVYVCGNTCKQHSTALGRLEEVGMGYILIWKKSWKHMYRCFSVCGNTEASTPLETVCGSYSTAAFFTPFNTQIYLEVDQDGCRGYV